MCRKNIVFRDVLDAERSGALANIIHVYMVAGKLGRIYHRCDDLDALGS